MTFKSFARIMNPALYDLIQPYKVTDEALMPEEYRYPNGRWRHDDWFFGKNIRRIDTAYRVPQPFRIVKGAKTQEWLVFDRSYPLAPGTQTKEESGELWVLADRGGPGLVVYEAYFPHLGRWKVVFRKYTRRICGQRLSWYWGLHQDQHVSPHWAPSGHRSDLMCWFPEAACSFVRET